MNKYKKHLTIYNNSFSVKSKNEKIKNKKKIKRKNKKKG